MRRELKFAAVRTTRRVTYNVYRRVLESRNRRLGRDALDNETKSPLPGPKNADLVLKLRSGLFKAPQRERNEDVDEALRDEMDPELGMTRIVTRGSVTRRNRQQRRWLEISSN